MLNQVGSVAVDQVQAALDLWIEHILDSLVAPPKLRLYQNNAVINEETVLADLTEATFSGYSEIEIVDTTWPASSLMPDGSALSINDTIRTFTQNAATVSNTIYGWYLVDGSETALVAAVAFPVPLAFDAVSRFLSAEIAMRLPSPAQRPESDTTTNAPPA